MKRNYDLISPVAPDELRFVSMRGSEAVSHLFALELNLQSPNKGLSPSDFLGKPLTVKITQTDGSARYINGQCTRFANAPNNGRHYGYSAIIQPWLWYATLKQDYRIFQHQSVPQIVQAVLANYGFDFRLELSRSYRSWEYCVQYRESDANFVMRLLEQEGIWFWFEHQAGAHTLVMSDDIGLASPAPSCSFLPYHDAGQSSPNQDFIDHWQAVGSVTSGDYSARDYCFQEASALLDTQQQKAAAHPFAQQQVFDYPGGYQQTGDGQAYAQVRMEELHSPHQRCSGHATARGVAPGRLLSLQGHPQTQHNQEYFILSCDYDFQANNYEADASTGDFAMNIAVTALPSGQPFRPARVTPKPISQGPDTAVVTGPAGKEIHTDEFGRVTVKFQWDRHGPSDQNSSCWIRAAHPWAGSGFGGVHVPRIGQEVLVDYLNGDPDRPIITSRVYNNLQPHPWGLPANATQSGFLTRSTPGGTADHANAFRFEDKIGEEQIWLHAQRNQDIEVEHDESHWVGNDRSKTIDRDETVQIKRHRTETVDGNETITVHENRQERVDHNETISIGDDRSEDVGKNETITIGQNQTLSIGKNRDKTIAKNETIDIGSHKKETIKKTSMQNVGLARMDNVGAAYSLNVGAAMNTIVGLSNTEQVGHTKNIQVGKNTTLNTGENLVLEAGKSITLKVGKSQLVMDSDGKITLQGSDITFTASGPLQITGKDIDLN